MVKRGIGSMSATAARRPGVKPPWFFGAWGSGAGWGWNKGSARSMSSDSSGFEPYEQEGQSAEQAVMLCCYSNITYC